jgi:hypothetical protein
MRIFSVLEKKGRGHFKKRNYTMIEIQFIFVFERVSWLRDEEIYPSIPNIDVFVNWLMGIKEHKYFDKFNYYLFGGFIPINQLTNTSIFGILGYISSSRNQLTLSNTKMNWISIIV